MEQFSELNKAELVLSELEGLPIFTDQDLMHLTLVSEGLKKVCNIEIYNPEQGAYKKGHENEYEKITEDFESSIERLESLLNRLGLPFIRRIEHEESDEDNSGYYVAIFDIGRDKQNLDALVEVESEPNPAVRHKGLGKIFEIPDSAVKAWGEEDGIKDRITLPKDVQDSEYFNFLDFALSKDNWEEELEFVKERAETIKKISPSLYKKITAKNK